MRAPQGLVVELVGAREIGCAHVLFVSKQQVEWLGDPGARVDAVRDRADRRLLDRSARPEALPHLARHLAVQLGNAVRMRRRAQCEWREPESLITFVDA